MSDDAPICAWCNAAVPDGTDRYRFLSLVYQRGVLGCAGGGGDTATWSIRRFSVVREAEVLALAAPGRAAARARDGMNTHPVVTAENYQANLAQL